MASRPCGCATATPWPHDSLVCAVNAVACPTSERSLFRLEATAFTGQPHVEIYACVRILPMLDTSTFLAAGYSTAPPTTIASVRKLLRAARTSVFGCCMVYAVPTSMFPFSFLCTFDCMVFRCAVICCFLPLCPVTAAFRPSPTM